MAFQRLVAIPQEEYLQLKSVQQVKQPMTDQMYHLRQQLQDQNDVRDPYARLQLQSTTLEEMKALKDKMRNYLSISTPKPYRNRAQGLFQSVEPHIQFNERGEIYDKTSNVIENSRLEDLIQFAVRDRRRNIIPEGWSTFVDVLREKNVPKTNLNRETLDEVEGRTIKPPIKPSIIKPPISTPISTPKKSPDIGLPVEYKVKKEPRGRSRSRARRTEKRRSLPKRSPFKRSPFKRSPSSSLPKRVSRPSKRYPSKEFLKDY